MMRVALSVTMTWLVVRLVVLATVGLAVTVPWTLTVFVIPETVTDPVMLLVTDPVTETVFPTLIVRGINASVFGTGPWRCGAYCGWMGRAMATSPGYRLPLG